MFLVCRTSSALGLEKPGDAAEAPSPESEKASDAVVLDAMPTIEVESSFPLEISAHANAEATRTNAEARPTVEGEPEFRDVSSEMFTGEPVIPPPLAGTILPVACLLTRSGVTSNPQQQPAPENQGVAGSSSGGILVTPPN